MHTELPEGERKLEFKLTAFPKKQRNPKNVPTIQSKGCRGWWRKTEKRFLERQKCRVDRNGGEWQKVNVCW